MAMTFMRWAVKEVDCLIHLETDEHANSQRLRDRRNVTELVVESDKYCCVLKLEFASFPYANQVISKKNYWKKNLKHNFT